MDRWTPETVSITMLDPLRIKLRHFLDSPRIVIMLQHASLSTSSVNRRRVESTNLYDQILGLSFKTAENYPVHHLPIELNIAPGTNKLLDSTSNLFGIINERARKIMDVLHKEITVQIFADRFFTNVSKRSKSHTSIQEQNQRSKPLQTLELCANLYGPTPLCEPVGMFTAKCKLYLQHPRHCAWNVPYRNPQSLSPEDGSTIHTFDLENVITRSSSNPEASTNLIDLFADVTVPNALEDADTPRALSTELYKHQKQALTFMAQRERGWAMDGHHKDIWKEERDAFGRVSFQNIISGSTQTTPPHQFRGGLLIDAPGLGKSLSILALIAFGSQSQEYYSTDHGGSSTTLVIVPKTLIEMWKDEIRKHLRSADSLSYCVYYGKDRIKHLKELERYALVITTYSVVRLDWRTWLSEPRNSSTLFGTKWGRIVLDEAHIIREPSKTFATSVCALEASSRWAVTGTPIQNRLMDLFSLFKFLRCSPFDDLRVFNTQVTQNWKARSAPESAPESVAKLKTLVSCLSLRRPKTTIDLLPRVDDIVKLDFSEQERQDYKAVKEKTLYNLDRAESNGHGTRGSTFLNALKWVNELRLICNHGKRNPIEIERSIQTPTAWNALEAQACFDHLDEVGLAKCSDTACCQDLSSALPNEADADHDDEPWISESLEIWCSLCFESKSKRDANVFRICNHVPRRPQKLARPNDECQRWPQAQLPASSGRVTLHEHDLLPTKVKALMQELAGTPDDIKSVVFSSWTKTFDIIQPQLCARSIRCVRLDGSLSASSRANVLRVFRMNPGIKVLLATISCGGVGLDLTAASRAYIMEPQWNPMSESQALDRIYRLGQLKDVETVRFIMKGSWEEQILILQRRKQDLADLTLNNGGISKAELTYGRLQYLKELVG